MNINKIITESINKIIVESVNSKFQDLWNAGLKLQQYRVKIHNTNLNATGNKQIISFVGHTLYNFMAEVERAIKRCVTKQNINESFSLSNIGINMPSELNAWYPAQQYYYAMKNMLTGGNYNTANGQAAKAKRRAGARRAKTGRNEKLIYLLDTVWPEIQREYMILDNQYNFNRTCQVAVYAKDEIENIVKITNDIRISTSKNKKT